MNRKAARFPECGTRNVGGLEKQTGSEEVSMNIRNWKWGYPK
jgi:hypothetical protein